MPLRADKMISRNPFLTTKLLWFMTLFALIGSQILPINRRVAESLLTLKNFTLGEFTLDDALEAFGPAKIIHDGDASEASTRINYFLQNEKTYLTLDTGEATGKRIVHRMKISRSVGSEDSTTIPGFSFAPADFGGLRLGQTKKEIEQRLSVRIQKNRYNSIFDGKIKKSGKIFDLSIALTLRFDDNRLSSIEVFQALTF